MVEERTIQFTYPGLAGKAVYVVPTVLQDGNRRPRVPKGMCASYFFGTRSDKALVVTSDTYLSQRQYARYVGRAVHGHPGLSHFGGLEVRERVQEIIDGAGK